jgi:hypothetical protein
MEKVILISIDLVSVTDEYQAVFFILDKPIYMVIVTCMKENIVFTRCHPVLLLLKNIVEK